MICMEFKAGLQRIAHTDIEAIRHQAEDAGFATFVLPSHGIVDRESFFEAMRATFPLAPPIVSSHSWDALSDSLWEGLHNHPALRLAIIWPNAGAMSNASAAEFDDALEVLADVAALLADARATQGRTKHLVVLVQ